MTDKPEVSAADVLAVMDREAYHAASWEQMVYDRDSRNVLNQERISARAAVAAVYAEHSEDQSVIAVWRGRCERAEAERDSLVAENKALREALLHIANHPRDISGAPDMVAIAANALALAARAEAP